MILNWQLIRFHEYLVWSSGYEKFIQGEKAFPSSRRNIYSIWSLDWYQKSPVKRRRARVFVSNDLRKENVIFGPCFYEIYVPSSWREVYWFSVFSSDSISVKTKQRLPVVHSVKPNQYTAPVPKEEVNNKTKFPIGTQRQAEPVHSIGTKRGC